MLAGLAPDGGLYVPETWPPLDAAALEALQGCDYAEVALAVMRGFVGGEIPDRELAAMIDDAYAGFGHRAVAPLRQLDGRRWLLELFHGPTLAFKDVALQLLGRLMDRELVRRGERATVIGATSGDTGSAAIAAFSGCKAADIHILHPHGRVSEVQRRQMTTVIAPNVHNIAVEGTFDDCQKLVKALFADERLNEGSRVAGVNSINWARIMAQIVYYVAAAVALGSPARRVSFAVPTGNFGDIYAGYVASRMGLPVGRLIVATNVNDILVRALQDGSYRVGEVRATMSPSMDSQVSSNFERVLFDASGRDGATVAAMMKDLASDGGFTIGAEALRRLREDFDAVRVDEETTARCMERTLAETGMLVDPHTAVGIAAADGAATGPGEPLVVLATAHPAKFPDAVEQATGMRPELPPALAGLLDGPERYVVLPNDFRKVRDHILATRVSA